MRLHAHDPQFPAYCWTVIHIPTARELRNVVWVDDATAQYGCYSPDFLSIETKQASRIEIHTDRKLILIDPVEGGERVERIESTKEIA